jgi:hypothetical protein
MAKARQYHTYHTREGCHLTSSRSVRVLAYSSGGGPTADAVAAFG